MSLIYLTGIPGVGKSTARIELNNRGYEAHDTDEDDFRCWREIATSIFLPEITMGWDEASADFKKTHSMDLRPEKVVDLAKQAANKLVFLCGAVPNEREVRQYFDHVICLAVDNETMQHRITYRTNNNYGKDPAEMADLLVWNLTTADKHKRLGATIVDASRPVDNVVSEIVSIAEAYVVHSK